MSEHEQAARFLEYLGFKEAAAALRAAPSASLRDPRAEARADGWDEAADFLAAMWDDGDQTPAGFDPKKTAEVLLLRDHARRIRALSTPSPAPDAEKETP